MKQIVHSPETLGQFLQRAGKLKKLTQGEAGIKVMLDQTTMSSIEQETIFRLLKIMQI